MDARTLRIRKYLRDAQSQAHPEHIKCLSRGIGAVIVKHDVPGGRIVSTGYNGPPAGLPRCDSAEHLREVAVPQMGLAERKTVCNARIGVDDWTNYPEDDLEERIVNACADCGECPRKLVDAPSGKRLDLCTCAHAEKNAIARCTESMQGASLFLYGATPCHDCARYVINAGISSVYAAFDGPLYSPQTDWMFRTADVSVRHFDLNLEPRT